jgi:hypothetical protein
MDGTLNLVPDGSKAAEDVNGMAFNQDSGCFVLATSEGIRVFNTDAF